MSVELINYTDKSIAVTGDGTKLYKDSLLELGGKYNPNLKNPQDGTKMSGWIFSVKKRPELEDLLSRIERGDINVPAQSPLRRKAAARPTTRPDDRPASPKSVAAPKLRLVAQVPGKTIPVNIPKPTTTSQIVTYTVVRPVVDMKTILTFNDQSIDTYVMMADETPTGVVEDVYVSPDRTMDNVYKLGIVNGKWQIIGVLDEHTISFQ